jgi:hypothetical protein
MGGILMKKKLRYFAAAFVIGLILLAALGGFALVDMTSNTYMPGQFGSLFAISSVDSEGMAFSFMGGEYRLRTQGLAEPASRLFRFRGLLSSELLLTRELTLFLTEKAEEIPTLWEEDAELGFVP